MGVMADLGPKEEERGKEGQEEKNGNKDKSLDIGGETPNGEPINEKLASSTTKKESLLRRLIRSLTWKKKKTEEVVSGDTQDTQGTLEAVPEEKEKEDEASVAVTVTVKEATPSPPPSQASSRPPTAPSHRPPRPHLLSTPSSATTAHSRPLSQLDSALKQFKLSTAASRENLRSQGSNQDLRLLDIGARRRPLPTLGSGAGVRT